MKLVTVENVILFAVALCLVALFGLALFPSIVMGFDSAMRGPASMGIGMSR